MRSSVAGMKNTAAIASVLKLRSTSTLTLHGGPCCKHHPFPNTPVGIASFPPRPRPCLPLHLENLSALPLLRKNSLACHRAPLHHPGQLPRKLLSRGFPAGSISATRSRVVRYRDKPSGILS